MECGSRWAVKVKILKNFEKIKEKLAFAEIARRRLLRFIILFSSLFFLFGGVQAYELPLFRAYDSRSH